MFQSRQEVPDWLAEYATSGGGGDAGGFSGRFASKDIRRKGKVCRNSNDAAAAPSPFMLVYTVSPSQSAVQLTSCTSSLRVVIAIYENNRPHQVFMCIIFPSRWPASCVSFFLLGGLLAIYLPAKPTQIWDGVLISVWLLGLFLWPNLPRFEIRVSVS